MDMLPGSGPIADGRPKGFGTIADEGSGKGLAQESSV